MLAGISGETGERIVVSKLLSFFPANEDATIELAAACTNVQLLSQSSLCGFVSESLKGHVKAVADILLSIKMRLAPEFAKGKVVPTVQRCIDRCVHFMRFQHPKGELKGWTALESRYAEMVRLLASTKKADQSSLTAGLISDLKVYWWLVPVEWHAKLAEADAALAAANGGVIVVEGGSSSSSAGPPSKKPKGGGASSSSAGPSKEVVLRTAVLGRF